MSRVSVCALLAFGMLVVSACADPAPPDPESDAGSDAAIDAGVTDASVGDADLTDASVSDSDVTDANVPDADVPDADGLPDASGSDADVPDADVSDAFVLDAPGCVDADGDGRAAVSCGGDDCDDARAAVNPSAIESCNGGVDDDCNGLADAADGVCVPCPAGYSGFDGMCANVDECAAGAPCGGAAGTTCTDIPGSYICTCAPGFTSPITGGTCTDTNECATAAPCGISAIACTNTLGSYICACAPGYGAPPFGGACADIDECATGSCGASASSCMNFSGGYACVCAAGYSGPATGGSCVDRDECATGSPCGATGVSCLNTSGSYVCACSTGYGAPASGGTCADANECALGTDDCDDDPAAFCTNIPGSFTCACPGDFAGAARGTTGCLLTDTSLVSLVPSVGALSPVFEGATTLYTLGLPPGATSVTFTPSVTFPAHASIEVNGTVVASGATSAPITLTGFAVVVVTVTVTTDSGMTRTYTVAVARGSAYIKASNTDASDLFGSAVSLSADGSTLAVGAHEEDSSAVGIGGDQASNAAVGAGAVYVFARVGAVWAQQAYLKASNTDAGDRFGGSVALSSDGSTLAVGARAEASNATGIDGDQTNNSALAAGAAYVFVRAGTTWSQQTYLKASNTNSLDAFGVNIALSGDGSTLAVGAPGEDSGATGIGGDETNTLGDAGAVYVFTRVGTTWSQQAYVKASNPDANDSFGSRVALSVDGSTMAVGAWGEDSSAVGIGGNETFNTGTNSGAVYVFTRAGAMWSQQAYVKASNTGLGDLFGDVLTLSGDGSTLAVGAISEDSNSVGVGGSPFNNLASGSGAVYVFARIGTTWTQQAYVKASNTGGNDEFGYSLALSADGATLAVGANREDSSATGINGDQANNGATEAGAVYFFVRAGAVWSQRAYVKASNTDMLDGFCSVALSADGSTLAVGARMEASNATSIGGDQTNNSAYGAGAVYVY